MGISLLVIACNEEGRLASCVASARPQVDEVVVVVQQSSDRTLAIAHEVADKVIEHPCHGTEEYSRADGIAACTHEWILKLDADEQLTLQAQLRKLVAEPYDFFNLRRVTTVGPVTFEDAPHGRLFRRDKATFKIALHHGFQPKPGARVQLIRAVCIKHFKTWDEQHLDNARYDTLKGMKQLPTGMPAWFHCRDDFDRNMFRAVVAQDEYHVRERKLTGACILDIGAHIGCFDFAVHAMGASHVDCYEPNPMNFAILDMNAARMQSVRPSAHAVGFADGFCKMRLIDGAHSGAAQFHADTDDGTVPMIGLDTAIERLLSRSQRDRVDLLKIDCEGGEWAALSGAKSLDLVQEIVGEWHCVGWNGRVMGAEDMQDLLEPRGFKVTLDHVERQWGPFRAERV